MKKSNQQKILEAKANLDAARMLEAIKSISEREKELSDLYGSDWDVMKSALEKVLAFTAAFRKFKSNNCVGKEIKFVNDIVDGIKNKAGYEAQIKEQEQKLNIARKSYLLVVNENKRIKDKLIKFVEITIDEKIDKDEIKKFIADTKSLDDIITENFKEPEPDCEIEQSPF